MIVRNREPLPTASREGFAARIAARAAAATSERPYVVAHVAVSVDGATTGFTPDVDRFYELITTWEEDATLVGADTILVQERALAEVPRPGPAPDAPLLVVVDGRRRVREWEALSDCGHWSDVIALRAAGATAQQHAPGRPHGRVREFHSGGERVDLAAALRMLREREGVRTVRVDSGGGLVGALLGADLVDELSLLVHPCLAGRGERRWHGAARVPADRLVALGATALAGGLTWLRYLVRSRTRRPGHRPAGREARPAVAAKAAQPPMNVT